MHHPQQWALDHVQSSATRTAYEQLVERMTDALDFLKTVHAEVGPRPSLDKPANSSLTAGTAPLTSLVTPGRNEHAVAGDVLFA